MKKILLILVILGLPLLGYGVYYGKWYSADKLINIKGEPRKYRIHVPLSGAANKPAVILLHGYGDNPKLMELYTGMSRLADEKDFVAIYPYGTSSQVDTSLSWNAGSCCGVALLNLIDDVDFINQLAKEVTAFYKLDKNKIYLAGFSNGAMLTYRIAVEKPDLFAGFGVVSGAIGGQSVGSEGYFSLKRGSKSVPMIIVHGITDQVVPYEGGVGKYKSKILAPVRFSGFIEAISWIKQTNKCQAWEKTEDKNGVIWETGKNCGSKSLAISVPERGHVWLGGTLEQLIYSQSKGFNTGREIWRFWNEQ